MTPKTLTKADLERFDPAAVQVMELARDEGRLFQQDYIGTEHILAALLRSGDAVVTEALHGFGIDLGGVRTVLHMIIARGDMPGPPPAALLTKRSRRVMDLARDEAGPGPVRPVHLLLALEREGGGVAAGILRELEVDLAVLRRTVVAVLAEVDGRAT